ncbi:universal stress protein [Curtobacterium sp. VKM Ac-1393]|uniref:universal stress protein n=1 Tax=Curtobacterium sp. VKM Ac-1393 TaxID=2783814 RepID=UPI00188AF188|nr:universal stress protein [Curtobacterium sp. VKM Ac-1393]MBF4606895.1 universal stress protein [Curtobacterium sp. VKM Ac-1393]
MTRYRIGIDDTVAGQNALAWIDANVISELDQVEIVMIGQRRRAGLAGSPAALLYAAQERLRRRHPRLDITVHAPEHSDGTGPTVEADVLVIGVRQASSVARALSGWVPERVTANSGIPVIAVPEHWEEHHGSIVVGIDADTSDTALAFAAEHALAAGCELTIVRAWQVPTVSTPYGYAYVEEDREIWAHQAEELVGQFARRALEQFPGLRVRTAVREGRAGHVIAGLSDAASLLVVGRRHHTLLGGALFGSVGQQLLRESGIPVATVPPDATLHSGPHHVVADAEHDQPHTDSSVVATAGAR